MRKCFDLWITYLIHDLTVLWNLRYSLQNRKCEDI
jgi:hypothetical protein